MAELYSKGAEVWIPHPEKVWEGAVLVEDYKGNNTIQVETENNEHKTIAIKSKSDLPLLRNPQILVGRNDLTSLSYLHEPAVLHNLQVRFCQNRNIYTYCGIVLVAINPYDDLSIYDVDTIQEYRGHAVGDLDPHIFAVAEDAYTKLEREQRDQSIIVSGESGAGKTVSAKYAMRYFATVGGSATETQIEKKVLASSPIMEAIGNAKTTRNDNSSRFGKFIELQFNKKFHISGALMKTYLLEKSRVVFQAPDERNYHIFYQLCAVRKEFGHLHLSDPEQFHYLNQGESPLVQGVDDLDAFGQTLNALNLLGFSQTDLNNMFRILASILHLGNVTFLESVISRENEQDQEGCSIPDSDRHMQILSELLEIDQEEMRQWLCTRKITSQREVFLKPMSIEDAQTSRDALAKHIYAQLFNWIVLVINKALDSNIPRHKFIGILDIYGFETFETNSFEQFCINYANEKLQQQFNLHVFKLEQDEYIKEGIEWKMIDFSDNQPCIDLIESKLGVLDLLDEECRMPRGSDGSWTEKIYSKCVKYSHFGKARFGSSAFVIKHFADRVQYESNGFLEKNRDTVIEEQISVIKKSKNDLVRRLCKDNSQKLAVPGTKLKVVSATAAPATHKTHKKSVGSQFRDSLNLLMVTLNATTPHYVRCIKPNDDKAAFECNPTRAVQQLRACGVLETIRISAAGFPGRWTYVEFFFRYRVLCKFRDINRNDMRKTCQNILEQYIKDDDKFKFGKTKIFFRAGQVAYLEKLRSDKLTACCTMMQKTVRAFVCRKRYLRMKHAALGIQKYGRGFLARRLARCIRRERAAIVIQKRVRGWLKRTQYRRIKNAIICLQSHSRGFLSRLKYRHMKDNAMAIRIQRFARGYLARKKVQMMRRRIVICQAAVRRFLARRQYRKLKVEARSIEHVKKLNHGLENKIISLQQRIDELAKNNSELVSFKNEANELKNKLVTFKAFEAEVKNLNALLREKNKTIDKLQQDIKSEKDEKVDLINEHERLKDEIQKQQQLWTQETTKLRKELDNINEIAKMNQKGAEENLKVRLEEEKMMILSDQDSDREAYQNLLERFNGLEQYCEELESRLGTFGQGTNSTIEGEDHGYGSVRSTTSTASQREKVENIDWKCDGESQTPSTSSSETKQDENNKVDVALVLKLQHKLAEVERDKMRLQKRLDQLDMSPRTEKAENAARDSIRISELELSNSNMKTQLMELQNSVIEGTGSSKLHEQLQELQLEMERKTEEVIQLKGILADQTNNMKSIVSSNNTLGTYINEDGELALAYETQKTINKQLELELQDEKTKFKVHEKEYKVEIENLRQDNERQQRILSQNLTNQPQTQTEAYMQHEITRLTTENLELHDKNDILGETVSKLRKQIKVMSKKLKEAGIDVDDFTAGSEGIKAAAARKHSVVAPSLRKKDTESLGMFSYSSGEENALMKALVIDLKPRTAVTLLPGLPAYIVFMLIRHTDYTNDEDKVRALISSFTNSVKKVIRKRHDDFETTVLWIANVLRLLHNMKQYSGDRAFQRKNSPKQNEQCLRNFDLSEYRQVLSDIAVWIYQGLIKNFADKVQPLIVPAILEHEEVPGFSGSSPIAARGRSPSVVTSPDVSQKPTKALLQEFTNHYKILNFYGVDPEVISQVFKQIFYFVNASSLNNLLLRKELCHWSKGLHIRHNLSHVEMWIRDKGLDETAISETLNPIIQAAHLLQARKTEDDVASVCEMCSALRPIQICKILNLYTPADEFEQRVPPSFIRKVQAKLQERPPQSPDQQEQNLMMDVKYNFPVRFPFNPSVICLEDVEIPEVLKLPHLQKL